MKKVLGMGVLLLWASTAFAGGYGDAGCGLGSMVFGEEKGFMQVLAATTNGISGNQTFGITSGTLNCDGMGLVLASRETNIFVVKNFDTLSKEMAKGEGETLNTLAALLGCEDKQFATEMRSGYSSIYTSSSVTPAEVLQNIGNRIGSSNLVCNPI